MKFAFIILFLFLSTVSFSQESTQPLQFGNIGKGVISPSKGALHAPIYNLPGYNSVTCDEDKNEEDCVALAWPQGGESVEIIERVKIEYPKNINNGEPQYYYKVEFNGPEGAVTGYVEQDFVMPDLDTFKKQATQDCKTMPFSQVTDLLEDLEDITIVSKKIEQPNVDEKLNLHLMNDSSVFEPSCKQFIDGEGNFGEWGKRVLASIQKAGSECFYKDINVRPVCPKFDSFSQKKKEQFWVYTFASIARDESRCDPTRKNLKAPNGRADGLLQLEYSVAARRAAGRDAEMCKTKDSFDTQDLGFQFDCAASTFRDINCKKEFAVGEYTYWQELNKPTRKRPKRRISQLVKQFPGCFK